MACSVMKAADCAAKNGVWLGTSCVDPNCAVSAFAGHNTLPFQMAYGLTDGTGVWQYAAAMTLESWSVTNSAGQSIATGTTASPLGYPIVVNGKLLVPPFTVAMSPSSAIVDGQTYKVAVKAKDKYGRSCSAVSNLTGHTPGLAAPPSRLTGSSSSNGVALSWTAPDPRYYVVSRYNIYRSDGSRWIGVAGVTPTSYTIPASAFVGVAGNVSFGVTSVNAAGVGPLSEVVQVSVAFPPAVPTGLTANVGTASTATAGFADLTWNASSGATSYSVRVSTTSGGPYTASQTVSATKATIPGLTIGQTYYFVIVATNSAGSSAPTASVTLLAKKYLP
jgi:cellulose 1,4-beta-cellobiosidase